MKKLFLLIVLLIVSFNIVLAQEININDKFKANYSVNSGDYPNLFINYDTVNGYVLLKIYYKKNNQENCGFLKLNSNSYDKYNGDTFILRAGWRSAEWIFIFPNLLLMNILVETQTLVQVGLVFSGG